MIDLLNSKDKITCKIGVNRIKDAEIMVSLKYLTNSRETVTVLLIKSYFDLVHKLC